MKQIVCEMCGGKDLIKQDGMFICQSCGSKYSVEEAKKMMVTIDTSAKLENALKNARRARENKNYEQAEECYKIVLMEEPDNWEANFYSIYFKAMQTNIGNISQAAYSITNSTKTVLKDIKKIDDTIQQNEAIKQMSTDISAFVSIMYNATIYSYNSNIKIYKGYNDNDILAPIELEGKIRCINEAHEKILPSTEMLKSFGNELISEFGKNEFTDSINIQCHETALKILKEFHNSIADTRIDTSGLKKNLQKYADDLKKLKPSSEVLSLSEKNPLFEDLNSNQTFGCFSEWMKGLGYFILAAILFIILRYLKS